MRRRILLLFLALMGVSASTAAGWAQSNSCRIPNRCSVPEWNWPRNPNYVSATYFDRSYPSDRQARPPAQHLGIDIGGRGGTEVVSPVTGRIMQVRPNRDPMQAYIVIEEDGTGWQHVLGHVTTTFRERRRVFRGCPVARMISWSQPHVHWGVNQSGVERAARNGWGWGRAPVRSTQSQARERGWIDPERYATRRSRPVSC